MEVAGCSTDFEDYTSEELDEIFRAVDAAEGENANESDVDVSDAGDDEEHGKSDDDDDDIPLARFAEWRQATRGTNVADFTLEAGPQYDFPADAKPIEYLKRFFPDEFFVSVAQETNRYAAQKIAASGRPDPLWHDTSPEEISS